MIKEFLSWIKLKVTLDDKIGRPTINNREIWWCSLGCNVGEEANGKNNQFSRPVLILKKLTKHSFVGLPLTSKDKVGDWYVPVTIGEKVSNVMLHQVRVLDSKRLTTMMVRLDNKDFKEVQQAFIKFYS